MVRVTLCFVLLLTLLGVTSSLLPVTAQVAAPPTKPAPAVVDPATPPAAVPATPGAFGPGGGGIPFGGKAADATVQTEEALRALAAAVSAQYQAQKARGEIDDAAKLRLARSLAEIFDLRQQLQSREIQMLEDRLQGIKKQVETRAKQRDAIIANQVEQILEGKDAVPHGIPGTGSGFGTPPPGGKTGPSGPPGGFPGTGPNFGPPAGFPAGGSMGTSGFGGFGLAAPKGPDVPRFEPIQVGLPDDLIGQLLQAKNDNDRDLVRRSLQVRINLLRMQVTDAQANAKRMQELLNSGAIDHGTADRAESRVKQLMLLLDGYESFRHTIK
jgi:hypothetical protein